MTRNKVCTPTGVGDDQWVTEAVQRLDREFRGSVHRGVIINVVRRSRHELDSARRLRSAAVTSKNGRLAASVTKRGPASGSRSGEPMSVRNPDERHRSADSPIGVKGR